MTDEQLTRLQGRVYQDIPGMLDGWLGDARAALERLTRAAADEAISNEAFVEMLRDFTSDPIRLAKLMHPEALAELMERAMGTAMAVGRAEVRQRVEERERTEDCRS